MTKWRRLEDPEPSQSVSGELGESFKIIRAGRIWCRDYPDDLFLVKDKISPRFLIGLWGSGESIRDMTWREGREFEEENPLDIPGEILDEIRSYFKGSEDRGGSGVGKDMVKRRGYAGGQLL